MRKEHDGWIGRTTRIACRLVVALALSGSSGCAVLNGIDNYFAYNDSTNDFVMGWRNHVWARQAWYERKGQFCNQPHLSHFGAGFRAGYENVASGGNGCPPGFAPREFWSWKYQTPEGQAQVAAWFAGFPYGAKAAEEDGAGLYQQIQVSHFIEQQYSPEFQDGTDPGVVSPDVTNPPPATPTEPVPAPRPNIQDAPPILSPQTQFTPDMPYYPEAPVALPVEFGRPSSIVPASHYEPAQNQPAAWPAAALPTRMPATLPVSDLPANSWALPR